MKQSSALEKVLEWVSKKHTLLTQDRVMLVLDEPADMAGAIVLPDQAKLVPVSGIVVLPLEDRGRRAYFRPNTEVKLPLGYDPRHAPYVGIVHVRDILMLEDVNGE